MEQQVQFGGMNGVISRTICIISWLVLGIIVPSVLLEKVG